MKCKFCEMYELQKRTNRCVNAWNKERAEKTLKHAYSVALVDHTWLHSKRNASRVVSYRSRGLGYQLNFCPECGKKLTRGKMIAGQSDAVLDDADKDDRRDHPRNL